MLDPSLYPLHCAAELLTPCLLLYPEHVRRNLDEMIRVAGNEPKRLRPHAKTHKCAQVMRLEGQAGITKHKCATLEEARLLAASGAQEVLIAYPQLGPNLVAIGRMLELFRGTRFSVVVDNLAAVERLACSIADSATAPLDVLLDLDTGMHRTGIPPDERAVEIALAIKAAKPLRFAGLHVYDGQNHQPSLQERQAAVEELLEPVWQLIRELNRRGLSVGQLVCGGTPTFPVFAKLTIPDDIREFNLIDVELSPGTCVLHDFNYGRDYSDMGFFRPAALLLCRVISKPGENLLTVDLGYKAVSADAPAGHRAHFLALPDAEQIQHSEEHLVLRTDLAGQFSVGDHLLAVPAHICPTVALYSQFHVIGPEGNWLDNWPIARGRMTQLPHVESAIR